MGKVISRFFAEQAHAKVYMLGRSYEKLERAVKELSLSVSDDEIRALLIPKMYHDLPFCIQQSDFVFESVSEETATKAQVLSIAGEHVRDGVPICSGSSGLSINGLSASVPANVRKNFFGVHFFNPPQIMKLVELTPSAESDSLIQQKLHAFLSDVLQREVVLTKDTPAYIGNRIGFFILSLALHLAEEHRTNGGIDYIDQLFGSHMGFAMQPMGVVDFVGLDVHRAIIENLHKNTSDYNNGYFVIPQFCLWLLDHKLLGRKSGGGLYKLVRNQDGSKTSYVFDADTAVYREKKAYRHEYAQKMKENISVKKYSEAMNILISDQSQEAKLCLRLMLEYIVYSLFIAKTLGYDVNDIDRAMLYGFGWCPPMAMIDALHTIGDIKEVLYASNKPLAELASEKGLFDIIQPSMFDFKTFILPGKKE